MELCIKTYYPSFLFDLFIFVSILVLMELCIKTIYTEEPDIYFDSFNPCFNGTMYKNNLSGNPIKRVKSFNPCFNGTMYKNRK